MSRNPLRTDRHYNRQKKAGLNLSAARLLSKLCDEAVLVGCQPSRSSCGRKVKARGKEPAGCWRYKGNGEKNDVAMIVKH